MSLSPVFNVVTPATDLTLLSIVELRAAIGASDGSKDVALTRIGSRVADALTQACHVATDGATPATLRKESVTDTFRLNRWWGRISHPTAHETLTLSRRPIVTVASVVEIGTLDPTSYEIRAGQGALMRLFNDQPSNWGRGKIVVTYDAGWTTVPEGLKRAAEKLVRFYWSEATRDPLVRQVSIPGVMEKTFWIGSPTDPAIPQDVIDDLGPYINPLIG